MAESERFRQGMATRRGVLGDAHVDRASGKMTAFDQPFQTFITEGAWGSVWSGDGLTRRERSIVTVALLAALGHEEELAMHIRATANTGASPDDIREALMHVAVYAGVPAANSAFKIAKDTYAAREAAQAQEGTMRNQPLGEFNRRDRNAHPPAATPIYKSTSLRSPRHALLSIEQSVGEITGPVFGHGRLNPGDNDMIRNYMTDNEAIGERIVVHGRVLDEFGRPVRNTLLEVWQANAGGRYRHARDGYQAALDPNFGGCGRCMTDDDGRYFFRTIRPGPYPFRNNGSDWRPAHIHFSIFGEAFAQRLVTQIYFEGDPLIPLCPIVATIPDRDAVDRLVAKLDMGEMVPFDCLAYRWDIVLRGRRATFFENQPEGL